MEPILFVAAIAVAFGVRQFAYRRVARGQTRFLWVVFALPLFSAFVIVWVGIQMWAVQPLMSIGLGLVGLVTAVLLVRMVRELTSVARPADWFGDVSGPSFDYLVWGVLGVPLLIAAILVVLAVTGELGSSR